MSACRRCGRPAAAQDDFCVTCELDGHAPLARDEVASLAEFAERSERKWIKRLTRVVAPVTRLHCLACSHTVACRGCTLTTCAGCPVAARVVRELRCPFCDGRLVVEAEAA